MSIPPNEIFTVASDQRLVGLLGPQALHDHSFLRDWFTAFAVVAIVPSEVCSGSIDR